MPRSIWKGAISFGLVNIPVSLYAAESRQELRFNQLDRRTMSRVREKRVDEGTGDEVPYEEIVKGYDTGGGHYVVLTEDDFKRANPKATQSIDILGFVNADEIDIIYYDKPYYLGPVGSGKKGYALLRQVLRSTDRVAVAKVVIRTKQYLCAVVARGDVMVLEVLRFAYELRDPAEIDVPSDDLGELGVNEAEITMAEQLVGAMVEALEPRGVPRLVPRRHPEDDRREGCLGAGRGRDDGTALGRDRRRPGRRHHGAAQAQRRPGEGGERRRRRR